MKSSAHLEVTPSAALPNSVGAPARPRPANTAPHLLGDIVVDYGPRAMLAEFFVRAEAAARAREVQLSFGTLADLVEINRQNKDSWRPLIPLFDPAHGIEPDTAFCILGRNPKGEIVATQAARLYPWSATDFQAEAEGLRLFYQHPEHAKGASERITVTAPNARAITGRVVFSGGGWYRPDYRGRWLAGILPRISRAYAFTRWYSDYTISIMAEGVVKGGMADRCGYTNVDWEVNLVDTPVGSVRCALVWMRREQMLADLGGFSDRLQAQVDAFVYDRAG